MSLQAIINSAVNIEINRSKLAAQSISRNGRILTAARNWSNPYRFTVSPQPIWRLSDTVSVSGETKTVRSVIEDIYSADRLELQYFRLAGIDDSFNLVNPGMEWMVRYQGAAPEVNDLLSNCIAASAGDAASGNRMFITFTSAPATDTVLFKKGDWIRPSKAVPNTYNYPYQVTEDIVMPPAATGITGTITSTDTITTITGVSSTANLRVGQSIVESGTNTGSFGGSTFITDIDGTTITIQSTLPNTAGSITFNGSGTTVAIPIHRGFIPQTGYTYTNSVITVGYRAARFGVYVTKLPNLRYLPGQFVEFTGDFELVEYIAGE